MNHSLFQKQILWLTLIVILNGCSGLSTQRQKSPAPPDNLSKESNESSYYYYTEAEINKQKGNIDKAIQCMEKAVEKDPDSLFLKKEQVLLYLMANRVDKVLPLLELIVKKSPRDIEALIMLGRVKQLLNHDKKEILKIYNSVIAIDPSQQNIYLVVGNLYLNDHDTQNAMKTFRKLVEKFPDAYAGYFYIGKIYKDQKKFREAEAAFLKSIEIEPNLLEARFEMIGLHPKSPQKRTALFKEILEIDPENIEANAELGLLYQQNGKNDEAAQIFMKLGQDSKQDESVLPKVVKHFIDGERFEDMITVLEGMAEASPDNTDVYFFLGMASDNLKDYDAAVSYFNMIDDTSGFYVKAQIHLSFIYHDMGKIAKSIEILENALTLHPENTDLMVYLGTFYEEANKFTDAEKVLKKGLEQDHDNPVLHFYLGVLYEKMGKLDQSIDQMKTVIKLDPQNANALNYLGYTYADQGINLDEAEQLILKALSYKPNDGYITDSLGWVYFKKGEFDKAVAYLEKALKLVPDDPLILEHMGDAYAKNKKKELAIKTYKKALKQKHKDPGSINRKIKELTSAPLSSK